MTSFDVDYPVECDDEYWKPNGDLGQAFQQPSGKPSVITPFVYELKLCEILAYTLRTLYATKKSKIRSGWSGSDWEQRIVAELDSSLNKWKDSLPEARKSYILFFSIKLAKIFDQSTLGFKSKGFDIFSSDCIVVLDIFLHPNPGP